ncbi:MAG: hypothetical protein R6U94_12600 [Nitriliruptoraceae bacterium]
MSDPAQLRAYSYLDRLQPQYAAFLGTTTQGDPPVEGMASLTLEMAPGNAVFRAVDVALKGTDVRPGAQVVEREFGMFEVHGTSPADVERAGELVLEQLGLALSDRVAPSLSSAQIITNVQPHQAQLLNRMARGMMVVAGETLLVLECEPAAYIGYAANEAEKTAPVNLVHLTSVGRFGRLWMAGADANVLAARDAAVAALEGVSGN